MNSKHGYQQQSLGKDNDPLAVGLNIGNQDTQEDQLDLGWLFSVVRRRFIAMVFISATLIGSIGSVVVLKSRQQPSIFEAYFKLQVEPITAEGQAERLALNKEALGGSPSISSIQPSRDGLDYETLILVLTSPKLMTPVVEQIQKKYPGTSYGSVFSNLSINRIQIEAKPNPKGTKIIDVRYRDWEPEKALFIVDLVSKAYLNYSLQERLTSVKQGINFFDKQLPTLEQRASKIQDEIQKLREDYILLDPAQGGPSIGGDIKLIRVERLQLEAQLANARVLHANVKQQFDNGQFIEILSTQGGYKILIETLQGIESQIATESALLRSDSPPIEMLEKKRQNLYEMALAGAEQVMKTKEAELLGLQKRYESLLQSENRFNEITQQFPKVDRRYSDLQRDLKVVTDTISEFLAKREALHLKAAQGEIPWELIQEPELRRNSQGQLVSVAPSNTTRQLGLVIILSTLFGIGSGFLIEVLIKVFHTPDEIKNATKLPVLGMIPFIKGIKQPKMSQKSLSLFSGSSLTSTNNQLSGGDSGEKENIGTTTSMLEAFRTLYTNIQLLGDYSFRSLVIGSGVSGDGKTTIALHLARTAAAVGQRVLLVDGDLRDPQLHFRLNLPNVRGLSDVVTTDLSLNDAIQRDTSTENLFVLTAGNIPPDPIKLLSSKKMRYLMEQFQAFFDLVIYDSPSLVNLADGSLMAALSDGIVLVVAIEKTDRDILMKVLEGLKISGASVLGVVANGVKN